MLNNSLQSAEVVHDACPWLDDVRAALAALPRDVSQRDVAAATGLAESWLSKLANGKIRSPDIFHVYRLAKYLNTRHV